MHRFLCRQRWSKMPCDQKGCEKLNEVREHFDELSNPLTDDMSDIVYVIEEYGSVKDYYTDCRKNDIEIIDTDVLGSEEEYEKGMALLNEVRRTLYKIF